MYAFESFPAQRAVFAVDLLIDLFGAVVYLDLVLNGDRIQCDPDVFHEQHDFPLGSFLEDFFAFFIKTRLRTRATALPEHPSAISAYLFHASLKLVQKSLSFWAFENTGHVLSSVDRSRLPF
jgi:hypothetical protein